MAKAHDPLNKVLERAATDAAFRRLLKSKPAKALAEAGVPVEKGVEYIVVEQKPKKRYIVLPLLEKPALSDEALEEVVAAGTGKSGKLKPPDGDDTWPPPE